MAQGLSHPVEGTILTVIRESAEAGQDFVADNGDELVTVMEAIVDAANKF
jgi:dihydroxyacetone kinase-like predicted kinase